MINGTAKSPTALEQAIVELARMSVKTPRNLGPSALEPLRRCAGDGALDYLYVLMSFHFINRIADLLHVAPEAIPETLRFVEPLRRVGVRVAARLLGGAMDLDNRPYQSSFQWEIEAIRPLLPYRFQDAAAEALGPFRNCPKIVEALRLALEARHGFVAEHPAAVANIERVVRDSLPESPDDTTGIHARPGDPVAAFAFVGTRYAQRTTEKMVNQLRTVGFDDVGILALAVAVADGNQWERCWRLAGLDPGLYWG